MTASGEDRATGALTASGIEYTVTRHGRVGSLAEAAAARGVEPRDIVKTLVVRRSEDDFLFVLVPGDREISWPKLRAHLGLEPGVDAGCRHGAGGHRLRARHDHAVRVDHGVARGGRRHDDRAHRVAGRRGARGGRDRGGRRRGACPRRRRRRRHRPRLTVPERRPVDLGTVALSVVEWPCASPGDARRAAAGHRADGAVVGRRGGIAVGDPYRARRRPARARASGWPGEYSIELMSRDVGPLLERLGGVVDLVGHSLAGWSRCAWRGRPPDVVRRLVLEDVGMPHPRRPAPPARPEGELEFDWRVVEQVRPQVDDPDPAWPSVARSVAAPTLVVAGGPRSFVAADHVAELVAALPDGRSVTLDTGHEVHEADPGGFTRELLAFLDA